MTKSSSPGHVVVIGPWLARRARVCSRSPMLHVLVIEDESTDPLVPRARARGRRHSRVDGADNGADGLERALRGSYDLVILDLLLPRLDGLSVLRELHAAGPGAAGGDRLGALRPADEAARLQARRQRLPGQAVRRRRAARARARAAARLRQPAPTTCSSAGRARARRGAPPGAHGRLRDRPLRPRVPPAAPPGQARRRGGHAATASCRRCGATTSTRGRTSSTSACAALRSKLGDEAPIETVRHAGYRLTTA